jgi:hypothetical protein
LNIVVEIDILTSADRFLRDPYGVDRQSEARWLR